eukprot:CAMPEP_0202861546 /NCGR_PEP_ID=MMETSP1391-20130828/2908_1 /ASSEMBLY_ACC=CAM_ASM_000867 /TAXON_ID=1034604 /ORGANISM="Chlamydomonas leiostraca, Strain SAG 11-49" /LENGTH=165 /DNA_ID=CAMNT_0049540955 /DNA_START=355 /DNA_END=852 /DNA_ORIENTATION=-
MTDFHPESWNPMWSVGTILTGLLSFFHASEQTTGSINTTTAEKQRLAAESLGWNVKAPLFRRVFPEWVEEYERRVQAAQAAQQGAQEAATQAPTAAAPPSAGGQQAPIQAAGHPGAAAPPQQPAAAGQAAGRQQQGSTTGTLLTMAVVAVVLALAVVPMFQSTAS